METIGMRGAVAMMIAAHAMFFLGLAGMLRFSAIVAIALLVAVVSKGAKVWPLLAALPLFVLAIYPPIAFDETLYHLPFVRAFGDAGRLYAVPDVRFPVFPVLHELLCVPAYVIAGDVGPHLVAVLQLMLIAALLVECRPAACPRAGWLAAALFLGSPLVVWLGTVLYVDMALALFITAGVFSIERRRFVLAGLFFGSACSVKYLGFYFAAAALVFILVRARWRAAAVFSAACAAAALPMTLWLYVQTGDPIFPYLKPSIWTTPSEPAHFVWNARVLWDVTFARERVGLQPPVTPFLIVLVLLTVAAAIRNTSARWLLGVTAVYLVIFGFLPQDARYLLPLLPMISLAAAMVIATRWPRFITVAALIAIAPGVAYAGYRLVQYGLPPITESQRDAWLGERVPGYRAVRLAGRDRVYVCRAERLKSYGNVIGDHTGPYAYSLVMKEPLAAQLKSIGAKYLLVAKPACNPAMTNGGLQLVYEDVGSQLWRVSD